MKFLDDSNFFTDPLTFQLSSLYYKTEFDTQLVSSKNLF